MIDPVEAFAKQFTKVDGGYLHYSSHKSGGKLVTTDEYDKLIADWKYVNGRKGGWKIFAVVILVVIIWTTLSSIVALPRWANWLLILGCVAALLGRLLWVSLAPRRLVRDRPNIAPPRDISQARREARAIVNWPLVMFALIASGGTFFRHLISPEETWAWWAWTVGSGLMLGAYLWTALQKILDMRH